MKKTILLIVPSLTIGGQERIAVDTAALLRQKYDVHLAVFQREAQEYPCPVPLIDLALPASASLPVKLWRVLRRNAALRRLKRRLGVTAAYSFGDIANVSNALSRAGGRTLLSVHGYGSVPQSRAGRLAYRLLCQRADVTLCVSTQIARELQAATGLPKEKFVPLYNPYPIAALQQRAAAPQPLPRPCIVAVGRLEEVKGYDQLLAAFRLVADECPGATLVLVGDGSCRNALGEQAGRLGLAGLVRFAGVQADPMPWLAGADVFALTSYTEGFPNAMIEAMACGLPVVALDCPTGPREILLGSDQSPVTALTPTPCGLLCPAISRQDTPAEKTRKQTLLAQALLRLLQDKAEAARCGAAARRRAADFDAEHYAQRLKQLL